MEEDTSAKNGAMDLVHGPVVSTLLRFSLPFMLSTLLQTLYSTVDTAIVGQFLGRQGLSGVSNGSQLMQTIYMLCIGFANAGQVIIAQARGAQNQEKVQKTIGTLFYVMIAVSLALSVLCTIFCDQLIELLNTPSDAASSAKAYVTVCGIGLIFTGLYNMFSAILRGIGDSKRPLLFVLIASALNAVLDVIFIVKLGWGVAGAAWATIIGQGMSVLFSFLYLICHAEQLGFCISLKTLRYYGPIAKEMASLGIPMAIHSGAVQFSFLFVNFLFNGLGISASAAFGVMQKLRNIPGILTQGLSLGCTSMMGQNLGARRQDRVSRIANCAMLISILVHLVFGMLCILSPSLCFRLFTPDEEVLAFADMCALTMLIEIPGKSLMPPCNALVSAQGFVQFSLALGLLDAFVGRVLVSWLLGAVLGMGAFGYFLGYALSTYLMAIPVFLYYITGAWKKRALLAG